MVSETVARRRMRTVVEKRRIVEETLVRGASVPVVARKYELNANLLFGWRRLYKQGLLQESVEAVPKLLPVTVTTPTIVATRGGGATVAKSGTRDVPGNGASSDGQVEIEWPSGVRVRLQGSIDVAVLNTLLATLHGR